MRRTLVEPGVITLALGTQTQTIQCAATTWTELDLRAMNFDQDQNTLKLTVTQGDLSIDWLAFE